ncbi:U3 small nucleolar RNA-associated protein [Wickerhamomyces ciferrii]|uniref:U3 small nucleolar RNA-associated protein n=1 Tax=Wickerhamomyces ciferrii (strain ATCC 14091 / BCRC 22168 / CBS 111 / JCM 3599 / NBRC 0793 / NRRL Y-1031 F-60-10) TaxID=1206466 RepID=K0KFH9_WICCF|nr:U3 small nucleolar RNA-associated protein [Wickerhamomyces ciferrii]CCH40987.1 U3 small nucleolar RNA-associated protein [Wickerhamomyces ciferrii]
MSQLEVNKADIVPPPKDEEELALEKLVFGDLEGFETNLKNIDNLYNESDEYESNSDNQSDSSDEEDEEGLAKVQDDELFFVDDGEEDDDAMDIDDEEDDDDEEEGEGEESDESDAWIDSEDEGISISLLQSDKLRKLRKKETDTSISGKAYISRLRSQFEKIYPRPIWADQDFDNNDDDEENSNDESEGSDDEETSQGDVKALSKILQKTRNYQNNKNSKLLPPNKLDITRLKDANQKHPSKSAIQTLSFHPTHPLLLTGGYDRTIRIYHVDGKINNVVTSLHLRDTPIQTASFNPNPENNRIYAGGRRRYMYSWDLTTGSIEKISRLYGHEETQRSFENFKLSPKGNFIGLTGNSGWINILSSSTSLWVQGFKIEGTLVDFDWSSNEEFLIAINSTGEIWEFNLKTKKISNKWRDETGVGITKVKLGGKNDRWCAVGSESGIVNIYDRLSSTKKPIGTLDQLVTTISSLEFSSDGQILCMASRAKKDALRLVHLPSCKVFQNWPTSGTPFGKVTSVAFSPNNEMISVGNEAGKVRLWRLNHY